MARTTIRSEDITAGQIKSADLETNVVISGDLTVDTDTLYVDSTSGNVGIGTINGTTTVSSGLAINNATAGNYPGLEIQTAGVTRMYFNANNAASYIASVSTNPMVFYTNGSESMRVDQYGSVSSNSDYGISRMGKANVPQLSIADDGFIYLTRSGIGGTCISCIYESGSGYGAVFAHGYNGSSVAPTMIASTYGGSTVFATSDTDGKYCVYNGSGHYPVFKNRIGSTRNFVIATFGASFI